MPNHEIAARCYYGKGLILWRQREYRDSIEAFQTLIHRFPKSEFAPECFLAINRVYLDQCQREFQNPDLLALAEINLHKFEDQFPGEERLELAQRELQRIKEVYARGMYETASYYERVDQPGAAVIYYQKAILDFPETAIAQRCRARLSTFCPMALKDVEEFRAKVEDISLPEVPEEIDFDGFEETGSERVS
jgi:outer membrane protein assembly factor BamD (BamD/ComL family)